MKKIFFMRNIVRVLKVLVGLSIVFFVYACDSTVPVDSIELTSNNTTLLVGESLELIGTISPVDASDKLLQFTMESL